MAASGSRIRHAGGVGRPEIFGASEAGRQLDSLDGHRVFEIGAIELFNRSPTGQTFHRYVCPERGIRHGRRVGRNFFAAWQAGGPRR